MLLDVYAAAALVFTGRRLYESEEGESEKFDTYIAFRIAFYIYDE